MSNRILNLVDRARIADPVTKGVLRAIANECKDAGSGVWSSKAYIAWCTGYHERTVQKHFRLLEEMKLLNTSYRPGTSNLYRIHVEELDALGEDWMNVIEEPFEEGGEPEPGVGENQDLGGENQNLPNPKEPKNKNSFDADTQKTEEPEYVNDVDGVPDERQMEWLAFLAGWKKSFPMKAQPLKSNTTLRTKFYARLKDAGFASSWRSALWGSKDKKYLQDEGWFKAKWFVHNNDNYEKLLDGTFDFKEEQGKQAPAKRPQFVDARPKEDA